MPIYRGYGVQNFWKAAMQHIYEIDKFNRIWQYLHERNGHVGGHAFPIWKYKKEHFSMSYFLACPQPQRIQDVDATRRFFWDVSFVRGDKTYYLTNQVAFRDDRDERIFNSIFNEYGFLVRRERTGEFVLEEIDQNAVHRENEADRIENHANGEGEVARDAHTSERCLQKIFFGAPGTVKSYKIEEDLFKYDDQRPYGLNKISEEQKFRTTFHPDYDYAQFVGAYKPKRDANGGITYSFVPQVFAKAYVTAWIKYFEAEIDREQGEDDDADNMVYLVIEEINRGNCAQIFGDIFQLLDRSSENISKDFSKYSIDADYDFAEYIKNELEQAGVWDKYVAPEYVGDGKIKLPPNLNILATMNTSDQSLFPMDSAFKRRFDWDYVPINYNHREANFIIDVGTKKYNWLDFLKKINENVYSVTKSEDKQMGEFFIKPKDGGRTIKFDEFRSKVLFYLWDSVYKDEDGNEEAKKVFHFDDGKTVTFQTLFEKDVPAQQALVDKIMQNLGVPSIGPAIQVAPNAAAAAEALAEGNNDGGDEGQV